MLGYLLAFSISPLGFASKEKQHQSHAAGAARSCSSSAWSRFHSCLLHPLKWDRAPPAALLLNKCWEQKAQGPWGLMSGKPLKAMLLQPFFYRASFMWNSALPHLVDKLRGPKPRLLKKRIMHKISSQDSCIKDLKKGSFVLHLKT